MSLPRRLPRLPLLILAALSAATPVTAQSPEAEIRATLDRYLAGHATGLASHFAAAFHPEGELLWVRDGELQRRTAADYVAGAPGTAAPDEDRRTRRVAWVDVAGDVAVARVELDHAGVSFVDYMTLARVGGRWRIVAKAFQIDREGLLLPSPQADSVAIAEASATFSRAYVEGDTATLRTLYVDDVILLPPGGVVEGVDEAVRYFGPGPRRTNTAHAMTTERLDLQGRIAIDVGRWSNEWSVDGGPTRSAGDRYLLVWRKGDDGRWRIAHDVWHRPAG